MFRAAVHPVTKQMWKDRCLNRFRVHHGWVYTLSIIMTPHSSGLTSYSTELEKKDPKCCMKQGWIHHKITETCKMWKATQILTFIFIYRIIYYYFFLNWDNVRISCGMFLGDFRYLNSFLFWLLRFLLILFVYNVYSIVFWNKFLSVVFRPAGV